MFDKVLIANRGEIACRINRTCHKMGIRTVAVYSAVDDSSYHVKIADEACQIGEAPPAESYLQIKKLLNAAKKYGAQAIHPGYGFLAESAEFAHQCAQSGIVFIGPSVATIKQMGAKDKAKSLMENAGVPVVPGYSGDEQCPATLYSEAEKVGYPLVIKAVLSGGGKGMRVVQRKEDFSAALQSARNEARQAFADERVLLECLISGPRHIEFQIFGDQYGNVIHLYDRDCSLQRRHQKIIEESPSPFLDQNLRLQMASAAVAAAKAVKYVGAGTVEFIVGDDREFFFIEMNTRLQVEHPVTELITGLDLVEWQLRIAAGEKIPLNQDEVRLTGHAIEARIYAENPDSGFLPSYGTLQCLVFPDLFQKNNKDNDGTSQSWSSIRIDTGVQVGGEISIHYDPMIAKLIVHSDSRIHAIDAMKSALAQSGVIGVVTNLGFLQTIIQHSDFAACEIDTLFVESNLESLLSEKDVTADWVYWGAAISCLLVDFEQAALKAQKSMEPSSPWNSLNNWRAGIQQPHRILLRDEQGIDKEVMIIEEKKVYRIINLTDEIYISVSVQGNLLKLKCNSSGMEELVHNLLVLHHESQLLSIFSQGRVLFTRLDSLDFEQIQEKIDFRLSAPMPGNVIRILVKSGEKVNAGQPLLVMEAMKMEHTIVAPVDGIVERVFFKVGDLVDNDEKLVKLSTIE